MKILHEKNGVKIGGYHVAYPDPARDDMFHRGASTPSPLEEIKQLFPPDQWIAMSTFINSDSEGARRSLAAFDAKLLDAIYAAGVPKAMESAKRVMQNNDLRPEVKSKRAAEPLLEALMELDVKLLEPVADQVKTFHRYRDVANAAFKPEKPEIGFEAVQELKAQEIRRIVSETPKDERVTLLDRLGKSGNLEALGALQSDPLGRKFAGDEIMQVVERNALDAHGIGFVITDRERSRDIAEAAGHRAAALTRALLKTVPAVTAGYNPGPFIGNDFEKIVSTAIE